MNSLRSIVPLLQRFLYIAGTTRWASERAGPITIATAALKAAAGYDTFGGCTKHAWGAAAAVITRHRIGWGKIWPRRLSPQGNFQSSHRGTSCAIGCANTHVGSDNSGLSVESFISRPELCTFEGRTDSRGRLSKLIVAPIIVRARRCSVRPTANDRQASYFCGQVYNTLSRRVATLQRTFASAFYRIRRRVSLAATVIAFLAL